jgi:hypothetical protein
VGQHNGGVTPRGRVGGAVAERLGHDDATPVLSIYGHLMPGSEDRTRKAVAAAWNPVSEDASEAGTAQERPR